METNSVAQMEVREEQAAYRAPTLVKQGSLSELTLETVPVSGGGSPWCGGGSSW